MSDNRDEWISNESEAWPKSGPAPADASTPSTPERVGPETGCCYCSGFDGFHDENCNRSPASSLPAVPANLKEALDEMRDAYGAYHSWSPTTSPPDWASEIKPLEERVQAARQSLVDYLEGIRAERDRLREDSQLLDWLDTLPCGISILADANFPQPRLMTPKAQGFSHTRQLIRETRAEREKVATECPGTPYELDGAIKCWTCGAMWGAVPKPDPKTHALRRISSSGGNKE